MFYSKYIYALRQTFKVWRKCELYFTIQGAFKIFAEVSPPKNDFTLAYLKILIPLKSEH